jgi:hypothetical protein
MPLAAFEISEIDKSVGIKNVITFVPIDNINSLRAFTYACFVPYKIRRERWFLFKKKIKNYPPKQCCFLVKK